MSMFSGVSATHRPCLRCRSCALCTRGFTRANAHFRHPCTGDSRAVLYSVLQLAPALPPSSQLPSEPGAAPAPAAPDPEQCRAFISARSHSSAPHRREPQFHHNLFSCSLDPVLASLWPESGTRVSHPHCLSARVLSQQAFPIPESGAKIMRFNGLSKWFGTKKQTDTRGIVTALCLSLWDSWPPVFP